MTIDMQSYRDLHFVDVVYRRLNSECSVVDVDDTMSYLDDCDIDKRVTECKLMVEVDYTGTMRLKSIMCSICYKLFNFPHKKMLKYGELYYCVSCKVDCIGKKDTIRNFMSK